MHASNTCHYMWSATVHGFYMRAGASNAALHSREHHTVATTCCHRLAALKDPPTDR